MKRHLLRKLCTVTSFVLMGVLPTTAQTSLQNPIIPGFAPDPAICRRGDDFFLATSSFQWWPAVPIYHSKDLKHWELYSYGITNPEYADLRRIGDSAGIWAPSLTYADGLFWLVFSPASGSRQHGYESPNYLTTAKDPRGPWSKPVYLNTSGNDASIFHDRDGRKWLLNTDQNLTPGGKGHAGVLLQEYSDNEKKLVGPVRNIFAGTPLGVPEGSKLYHQGDWYYLLIAEGGTGYGHAATMARSRNISGPYEAHPENPILTARDDPANPIQRAGHPDIVNLENNRVALVYLASRPVEKRSLLGRETFLADAHWSADGWLRLEHRAPQLALPDFGLKEVRFPEPLARDNFDGPKLDLEWNTARQPMTELQDLNSRPGWLTLTPTPSFLTSIERPNLLARRVRHHAFTAETNMEFSPTETQQWAGLICYYDTRRWYFLHRALDQQQRPVIALYTKSLGFGLKELAAKQIVESKTIRLGVTCDGRNFQFRFAKGHNGPWEKLGPPQDALILSDEQVEDMDPIPTFGFTGAFVGIACFDLGGRGPKPMFDWFEYQGENEWRAAVAPK
jgi:xylan 1,4-beta-xylosidase